MIPRASQPFGRQLKIVHIRKSSRLFFDYPLPKMQQTVCSIFDPLLTIFAPSQLFIWFVDQFIPAYLVARSTLSSASVTSDLAMSKIPVTFLFHLQKIFFSNFNSNCSKLLDLRNLQEQVKKEFCYQKLFSITRTIFSHRTSEEFW